jgi:tetratricopeptide (TPR) repeat protein
MHLGLVFDSLQRTHRDAFLVLKFYSFLEPESIPLFDTWLRPEKAAGFRPEPSPSPPPKRKASTQGCFSVFASCFRDSSPEPDDASPETTLHVSEQLAAIFQNQERRERAIAKLCDLNLTSRIRDGRVLWMHDITHKAVRATTPPQDAPKWTAAGMDIVYHMMPEEDNNAEEHVWVDKCLLAAMALIRKAQSLNTEPREYICLLVLCAVSNLHHGAWSLSREQFEKAKPLYDQNLGPDHPRTIAVLHKLALAARHCGDMAVSEKYCRQAWKLYEGRLGPTAAETLNVLNDLASTIERAGRLKEAEVMFEKLYERERQESGLQGPRTMAAAHNLALCLHNQGRLRDAEVMYRTAVDASEKYLGPGNTGTLKTLGNYAATLDHDGRFAEAQAVYDRALGGFIRVMGFDHLLTLRLRGNMAGLLRQQGNFARAEIMMREVLDTLEKTFGSDSFETIQTLYEMGEVWQAQGDVQKARGAFEDAMGRLSGDMMQHPVVFRFIDSWGAIEREMGHLETAREKSEDAYHRFEDLLGWDDPYTLMAANDYAEVLHAGGQYQEAWDLLVRCRGSFATLLGKEHPHYAMVLNNIGRLCWILKTEEPMPFFKEARTIMAKRVGESHYCTATVSLNVARTVFFAGDTEGALALVAKTQETLEAALTAGHPLTAACDTIMGMMIASRGDQESLVKAQEHFCAATETAQMAEKTMSADYFLNICLLVLVLRQLKGSKPVVGLPDDILESPAAHQPSLCWDIPGVGRLSATQLTGSELKHFSFKSYIPLAIGETIRLRWGRKTCWREAESVRLQE